MNILSMPELSRWSRWALVLAVAAAAAGCAPEIPQDEDVVRTEVVLDSESRTIPLPNDLALDDQGTLPDVAGIGEASPQGIFAEYFTQLHGWLPTTPISIPVDGPIDPASLSADNLVVYQLGADGPQPLTVDQIGFDSDASEITASLVEPLDYDTTYGFVLYGDIQDPDGQSVVASQAIYFASMDQPLLDDDGEPTIGVLEGRDAQAQQLEGLRQALDPLLDVAAAGDDGVARDDVLSASIWTTAQDPIAVVNPDTGTIPLPNDAALDDEGTIQDLPGSQAATAQGDFLTYLSTLHGWLASTPLEVPFNRELNQDSVSADAVHFFEIADDGSATELAVESVSQTVQEDGSATVTITPAEPLERATKYGYVLTDQLTADVELGGESTTLPALPDLPVAMAKSDQPLVDAQGASQVAELSDAQAAQIEGLRQLLAPTYAAAESAGIDPASVVAATFWHTVTDSFAVFDPNTGDVPFPNEFVRGDDGTIELPLPADADTLTSGVIGELNTRDGFSVTADGYLPIAGPPLDPATVTTDNVPVAWTEGVVATLYTDEQIDVGYNADYSSIVFGPTGSPFIQGKLSAGLVSTEVKNVDGVPIKPSPAFVFLRSKNKLFEDDHSTVNQLDDATAERLEEARQEYALLFAAAMGIGYPDRSKIAVAWAFETDVSTMTQQQLNAQAEALVNEGGSPTASGDPSAAQAAPSGFDNVGITQTAATYTTRFFVDQANPSLLLDTPVDQPVPITVSIPDSSGACGAGPYKIVILGHGLGGSREQVVGELADALAANPYCLATVAADFPLHGDRTPAGNESGEGFLSVNPVSTKNFFLQAAVDLGVLTEVIKEDGLEDVLDADASTDLIDEASIGYAGVSLGGLIGTTLTTIDADVTTAALNVAGAKLTDIVLNGAFSSQILPELPAGLTPGTFDFFQTFSLLQWVVEPADPWTFAPHATDADKTLAVASYDTATDEVSLSDEDTLPANDVLVQMAGMDQTIPNSATQRLAEALGVSLEDTTFPDAGHGFVGESGAAGDCARQQIAQWLSSGLNGQAELTAAEQNACGTTSP